MILSLFTDDILLRSLFGGLIINKCALGLLGGSDNDSSSYGTPRDGSTGPNSNESSASSYETAEGSSLASSDPFSAGAITGDVKRSYEWLSSQPSNLRPDDLLRQLEMVENMSDSVRGIVRAILIDRRYFKKKKPASLLQNVLKKQHKKTQ